MSAKLEALTGRIRGRALDRLSRRLDEIFSLFRAMLEKEDPEIQLAAGERVTALRLSQIVSLLRVTMQQQLLPSFIDEAVRELEASSELEREHAQAP